MSERYVNNLPERLRRLNIGDVEVICERLSQDEVTEQDIRDTLERLRNTANSAIHRATADGRKYNRESIVARLPESFDPVVQVLIQRKA